MCSIQNSYSTSRKEAEIIYVYTTHVQPALPWAFDFPAIHQSQRLYTYREKQSSRAVGIVLFQSCVQYFNLTGVLHQLSLNLNWLHMITVDTSTMDLKQGFVSPIIEIQGVISSVSETPINYYVNPE